MSLRAGPASHDKHAVYLDTPVLTAVRQVAPFFDSGIFNTDRCNTYIRRRALTQVQRLFTSLPKDMGIRPLKGTTLPLQEGSVVFYPFNAQSNMNAVTQRHYHHVLTLHGESNKAASFRPAARLYDYICVAGPLAIERYLDNAIFTQADVDGGRLIAMGDSFVQRMPWLRPATSGEDGALFYCPTWEGFGSQTANYSSVKGGVGFDAVARAGAETGIKRVVIKPHPYLGLLRQTMWRDFIRGTRDLLDKGFDVSLALDDVPAAIRLMLRAVLRNVPRHVEDSAAPLPVRLGITDVSGMEAVLLVANVPTLVIHHTKADLPARLGEIMQHKALTNLAETAQMTRDYLARADDIDTAHKAQMFSWHAPELASMSGPERLDWLISHVQKDGFWRQPKP